MKSVCEGVHRFFVATDGTIEGISTVKIYAVVVCTVCRESHLIEHILSKDAVKYTHGTSEVSGVR